eukprot:3406312-Lingulodinium_polyedra.AAC.1
MAAPRAPSPCCRSSTAQAWCGWAWRTFSASSRHARHWWPVDSPRLTAPWRTRCMPTGSAWPH